MQPTTLKKAIKIAAEYFGRSAVTERDFLVRKINETRRALFKNESNRKAFFRAEGCECVRRYVDQCNSSRCRSFEGITLPVNVIGLEYLECNGRRIDLVAERLENQSCGGCLEAEILPTKVPLHQDIPGNYKNKIRFVAKSDKDKDKRMGVHYVTTDGALIREDLLLTLNGVVTSRNVVEFKSITLPERCGYVEACLIDGYVLDTFHPSVLAPKHPRLRISGLRCGTVVNWQGVCEPLDVVFDTDLVEFASELDWQNTFMLLDLHFKTGKSNAEAFAYKSAAAMSQTSGDAELKASLPVPVANLRPKSVKSWRRATRWLQAR